jgi:F-type H+-transporting ATPase subunit c
MRTLGLLCMGMMVLFVMASPVQAQDHAASFYGRAIAAGLGAGLTIIGAGFGFGKIGASALESMARQPETAGKVQTAMLIIAALLEGATFFSLAVCILMALGAVG